MTLLRELFLLQENGMLLIIQLSLQTVGFTGLQGLRVESIAVRLHSCSVCQGGSVLPLLGQEYAFLLDSDAFRAEDIQI